MEYQLKYWGNRGKYQVLYDAMQELLVPAEGKAETKAGEMLRLVGNVYYERFNNGGSFSGGQRATDGVDLKKLVSFTTPAKDKEEAWDEMVDKVMEAAMAELAADPVNLKKVCAKIAA